MSFSTWRDMAKKMAFTAARLMVFPCTILAMFMPAFAATTALTHDMQHGDVADMNHSVMEGMSSDPEMSGMEIMQPAALSESRTPIPPVTDADRKAAFPDVQGHKVHDSQVNGFLLFDQLEWHKNNDSDGFKWNVSGWLGGDIDRLWLRSEGETLQGKTESAEVQALWGHSLTPWWDMVAGVRQDFKPGKPQTWFAAGFQGMALYNLETELTAFAGEQGRTALRLEAEYDVLLTNRLILQPSFEANIYGKDDEERNTGKGLSSTELALRLRYEVQREFAPYVGVSWNQLYGNTANMAAREGDKDNEVRFLLGARMWF